MNIKQDPQLQVHITIFEERTLPVSALLDMHNTYVRCKSFVHTINILIDRRVNVCHNCVHKLLVLLATPPPRKKKPNFWEYIL